MAKGELTTTEQEKGHINYRAVLATGRKKPMEDLLAALISFEKKGLMTILAQEVVSKTKLLRQYDQLRILVAVPGDVIEVDPTLTSAVDYYGISDHAGIELSASTFKELDVWLKWNIKEHTAQYQLRGGLLEVREDKERQANGAVLRICHYTLRGDLKLTFHYRDRMLEQKLADPKSIKYKFWDAPGTATR